MVVAGPSSALALAGMGIGNVVIPPLVKRYFSDRLATMSSVYIVAVQIGIHRSGVRSQSRLPTAFGWRFSIGWWSAFGFAAAVPWLITLARSRKARANEAGSVENASDSVAAVAEQPRGQVWRSHRWPGGWPACSA